jgi:N-acetylglucosamine-6-phosphate deacetylase
MTTAVPLVVVGRHYRTRQLVELEISGEQIAAVRQRSDDGRMHPWIAPGFIDIQSNGYGGQEFSSPKLTVQNVVDIALRQAEFGVTQFLPTVTTASGDTIRHSLRTIAQACREYPAVAHAVPGIHVEGPYIAREDGPRGAHPLEHCRPPDWREFQSFQEAAEGRVRLLTLSPEYAEAPDFIRRAVASGVVISIGHTSADSAQICAAVDAGARLSTHLGNGAHRMLRRHPNYLWDQLADDRLMASLIVDGHHLPREVVKTMVRAKTPPRCILVSDLSGLAGLPPGRYTTELCELEILPSGKLVIAGQDQLLAGASLPIGVGVANVMAYAGIELATAIDMATEHPAELMGLEVNRLEVGNIADLVVFELQETAAGEPSRLIVLQTIARGEVQQLGTS